MKNVRSTNQPHLSADPVALAPRLTLAKSVLLCAVVALDPKPKPPQKTDPLTEVKTSLRMFSPKSDVCWKWVLHGLYRIRAKGFPKIGLSWASGFSFQLVRQAGRSAVGQLLILLLLLRVWQIPARKDWGLR